MIPAPTQPQRPRTQRAGFSLFEILLALAILGASLAILSRIAENGTSAAREARDLSVARIICQSKLSEILLDSMAGTAPQSSPPTPLPAFDSQATTPFSFTVDVQPAPLDGILAIRVTVEAQDPNGGPALATYSLMRWMIDPALGLEEAEAEEEAAQAAAEEEAAA
ncbi:MAG: type II secretion system protein [Rubripirellula sp.]